jgi:transcriptional regulator GlxA family with amidase domain
MNATTHHDFYDMFEKDFPRVHLVRNRRFVDNGKFITAGGLTSGVDAALHVISRVCGESVARTTAVYMEHDSNGWMSGLRTSLA